MYILIPDVKIRAAQQNTTNKVWPISGWAIKSKEITDIKIIDIKYLNKIFDLLLHKIVAKITIKNGFKTSNGWNRGKKNKSIHLFEPLTSTPTNGTKNKEISEIKKRKNSSLDIIKLRNKNNKISKQRCTSNKYY